MPWLSRWCKSIILILLVNTNSNTIYTEYGVTLTVGAGLTAVLLVSSGGLAVKHPALGANGHMF